METIQNPQPERESVTPLCGDEWHYSLPDPAQPCPTCGTHGPTWAPADHGTLQRIVDVLGAPEPDEQPAEPAPPAAPERTIGIEVVTDHLRRTAYAPDLPDNARIATVDHDGRYAIILDNDVTWRAQIGDRPPLILARMLVAIDSWARDVGAQVLMPGADVLAALDGRPDGGWWSTPIRMPYRDIQPGWLICGTAEDGTETRELVTARTECADDDCPNRHDGCVVHFVRWTAVQVRVPADFIVDSIPAQAAAR